MMTKNRRRRSAVRKGRKMHVKILKEAGYEEAILGISLSHGSTLERAREVALNLAPKDGGHNKFLESIFVWLDVTAPRYWWQEADTYRLSTKQSTSTMHTIQNRILSQEDFGLPIHQSLLDWVNTLVEKYALSKKVEDLVILKNSLPEGFLQRRIWVLSYKTLRNILIQRTSHRLPEWRIVFCPDIRNAIEHPELLPQEGGVNKT